MPRIQSYENQESISPQGTGAYISPSILADQQAAVSELSNSAKQFGNVISEQFAAAERVNTVADEETKMMDFFFKLEDETKNLPYEQQMEHFKVKSNEYRLGLRERVSDIKALSHLENSIMGSARSHMFKVREDYRKKVAGEGIAKVEDGDNVLTTNMYKWADTPQLIYQELDKRFSAWDQLVNAGHVAPEVAQRKKEALGNQVDYSLGLTVVENNPRAALEQLKDGNQFPHLQTNARATLINAAQAEIKRQDALRKQEEREARTLRMAQYGLVRQDAMFAIKELEEKGGVPKDYQQIMGVVSRYSDLDGGRLMKRLEDAHSSVSQLIDFKGQDYKTQEAEITNGLAKYQAGELDARDKDVFERKIKMFNDLSTARSSGDVLSYMRTYNIAKVAPLDLTNEDSIAARAQAVESARTMYGVEPNILLPDEAKAFTRVFKSGGANEQRAYTQVLQKLTGNSPDKMQRVLKQLHEKDSSIADEVNFLLTGDKDAADTMAKGRKRFETNPAFLGDTDKTLDAKINGVVDELGLNIIDPNHTMRRQIVQGLRNMYFGMASETIKGVDDDLITKAADKYFGGRIVEVNGKKTVPFAKGEDSMGHQALWNWMQPTDLKTAGNGEMPMVRLGTQARELTVDEVKKKGTLIPYDNGTYILGFRNKPSVWNKEEVVIATDRNGQPYTLDMGKVVPTIKANMVASQKRMLDSLDQDLGIK
jgi:hypothetical protein